MVTMAAMTTTACDDREGRGDSDGSSGSRISKCGNGGEGITYSDDGNHGKDSNS